MASKAERLLRINPKPHQYASAHLLPELPVEVLFYIKIDDLCIDSNPFGMFL
jgi:hypothetical protein